MLNIGSGVVMGTPAQIAKALYDVLTREAKHGTIPPIEQWR